VCILKQLKKLETDKKNAARTGFSMKVKEINETMRKYDDQKGIFQEEVDKMKELLTTVREKLRACDDEIKQLKPSLQLDSLEKRCN